MQKRATEKSLCSVKPSTHTNTTTSASPSCSDIDFSDDVIDAIGEEGKINNYVHLPVQSGSNAVLERMRRGYSIEDFLEIVAKLRSRVPEIAISTDILSGFCGETEDDHRRTLELMAQVRFDSAFMFQYSERDLTFAAKRLEDDVVPEEKKRRLAEIIRLQEQISREVYAAQVGKVERVLIHSRSKRSAEQVVGRTDTFKSVILPVSAGRPGEFVDATIVRSTMATLFGEARGRF
jgi:tRNA-2-methylthio-N6-dimethylallyladenosine synthase